ncbi:16477_t:CDS:2, partial [Racocetra fulgida]
KDHGKDYDKGHSKNHSKNHGKDHNKDHSKAITKGNIIITIFNNHELMLPSDNYEAQPIIQPNNNNEVQLVIQPSNNDEAQPYNGEIIQFDNDIQSENGIEMIYLEDQTTISTKYSTQLIATYPNTAHYLNYELYPSKESLCKLAAILDLWLCDKTQYVNYNEWYHANASVQLSGASAECFPEIDCILNEYLTEEMLS